MSPSISEKASADFIENESGQEQRIDAEHNLNVEPAFAKRTMRRIDLHLLPILAVLYSISLIDRVNISNAYVAGMARDLELQIGSRYSLATLIFFVPYIIFELPSNILIRKIGAARWVGSITFLWGSAMIGMAFVKHWWQLVICRAILGVLEAGFFPACAYIISTWYIRREVQKRLTGFYVVSVMISGFSSAMAGGIAELEGTNNMSGWQWIFLIFGLVTVVGAVAAYLLVQDFPDKNTFLSPEQTAWVLARIDADRSDAQYDHWTMKKFWSYMVDPHLWSFAVLFGAVCTTTYAFAYFLPIILVRGMGYTTLDAQLLTAPPYVFAAIFSFSLAIFSDKTGYRGPFIIFQSIVSIVGLCLTAFHTNNAVRYFGVFFGIGGGSANVASVLGYLQNNTLGYSRRGFATAITIGGGGVGGIIASTVFRSKDAPGYRPGLWVVIGAQLLIISIICANSFYYYTKNKAVREGRSAAIQGRPGFFYTF
ncbi:MFS general substrate transporter [Pleurotus eryngii]|uniref:MFS general substrate transporter n=1 Tax=Pleurotus eryngii TaxID=5323 RepID=A0A9P6DD03_PLEER|nr:MFS general substrate transporter [Pleurotus eryngii]